MSILGDTLNNDNNSNKTELTLENISYLISSQLKENNKAIIKDLHSTIITEVNQAILKLKEEMKEDTRLLCKQNDERKKEIEEIQIYIEKLRKENEKLIKEIKEIENKVRAPEIKEKESQETNNKKIVLYGLHECKESEYDLHRRVADAFREILNIDLLGYIEETHRMGRFNNNRYRPLMVELISKKMTKYILNNSHCFRGTGLSISQFMEGKALKEMKLLREEMFKARTRGKYAVIRNNKLYIEGQKIELHEEKRNQEPNTSAPTIPIKSSSFRRKTAI
ncbi:uncharacterized protein LOC135309974 [Plodia interpunctella]|uniref:uncharacterized protein LOC135309974 n=1 Tax=Plodia interpunctella TaxID=58824 RepID=UPI003100F9AA